MLSINFVELFFLFKFKLTIELKIIKLSEIDYSMACACYISRINL